MKANVWNAALFAGKREFCVLSVLVMMLIGGTFLTHKTFGQYAPTAPVAPSDLVVASDGGNALMLIWDDNSDNEDNFVVERKVGTNGAFSTIATLPADTTKWRDDNSANLFNTPYVYQVKAVNSIGESKQTKEESAVTELPPSASCQIVTARNQPIPPTSPAPNIPYRFKKFRDDLSKLEVLRLTDEQYDRDFNATAYSYWKTFNSNNTRIFILNNDGAAFYQMDPEKFIIIGDKTTLTNYDLEVQGLNWSKTEPNIVYATKRSNSAWVKYNISTNTEIETRVFTANELRGGELKQMTVSEENDDVFAWELRNACPTNNPCVANAKGSYFFTYKHSASPAEQVKRGLFIQNRLVPNSDPPEYVNDYNEMHVSKNGDYLLRALDNPERRDFFATGNSDPTPRGFQYVSHFDLGRTFLVGDNSDSFPPRFFRINYADILATQQPAPTILFQYNDWRQAGGHISLLATDEATNQEPWALVSNYTVPPPPPPANQDDIENIKREIFMISTNGLGEVKRLAHHYSLPFLSPTSHCASEYPNSPDLRPFCYYAEPRANISRDGKFIAFTSNWGVYNGRKDVFILKTTCPTAVPTSVILGGRVVNENGTGLWKARITLIDSMGNTRIRQTTPGGYYTLDSIPIGSTQVTVSMKNRLFAQPTQTVNAIHDEYNINFTALPHR